MLILIRYKGFPIPYLMHTLQLSTIPLFPVSYLFTNQRTIDGGQYDERVLSDARIRNLGLQIGKRAQSGARIKIALLRVK